MDGLALVPDPGDARRWRLTGPDPGLVSAMNAYLGYLADRNYSPRTVRTYGYGLLAFARWLAAAGLTVEDLTTSEVLDFLAGCRQETIKGRPGPNVLDLNGHRRDRLAPASVNLRLAAVTGLYEHLTMNSPGLASPIPRGRPSSWFAQGERSGLLAHTKRRPAPRSRLRVRTPRRLPRALDPGEVTRLLGGLRTRRDLAMAGMMLYCGLRSCEVLALQVTDVDIGGRWLTVHGKGGKDRRVPLDGDVAAVVNAYLLTERPDTDEPALFVVAKGPTKGRPLTRLGCGPSSATTGPPPACRPGRRMRCGTRSARRWPKPAWTWR